VDFYDNPFRKDSRSSCSLHASDRRIWRKKLQAYARYERVDTPYAIKNFGMILAQSTVSLRTILRLPLLNNADMMFVWKPIKLLKIGLFSLALYLRERISFLKFHTPLRLYSAFGLL
jgi:hypothetical protein